MTETKTYPLRLPRSLKAAVEEISAAEGTSVNQFMATAVAEKVGAMRAADFFAERRKRADWDAFDRLMGRGRGEEPRPGDERPAKPPRRSRRSRRR